MITCKENKDSDELLQKEPCPISAPATFPMNGSLYVCTFAKEGFILLFRFTITQFLFGLQHPGCLL